MRLGESWGGGSVTKNPQRMTDLERTNSVIFPNAITRPLSRKNSAIPKGATLASGRNWSDRGASTCLVRFFQVM